MAKDFELLESSNPTRNPSIHEISDPRRRIVLRGGMAAALAGMAGPLSALGGCASLGGESRLGFKRVAVSSADSIVVPEGYTAQVIAPWGDPVGLSGESPAFKLDASNTSAEQEAQFGMHHDGIHY